MSEVLDHQVDELVVQQQPEHERETITLDAALVSAAFDGAYHKAFHRSQGGQDAADTLLEYRRQNPEMPLNPRHKQLKALPFVAAAAGLSSSFLPPIAAGLVMTRSVYLTNREREAVIKKQLADNQSLREAEGFLAKALGGVELTLWRDDPNKQLIIEPVLGVTPKDNREILSRLGFLQDVILASGRKNDFGGIVITNHAAADLDLGDSPDLPEIYELGTYEFLDKLGKKDIFARGSTYKRVEIADINNKVEEVPDEQAILIQKVLERYEPNHPALRAMQRGEKPETLGRLAKQQLEERMSSIVPRGSLQSQPTRRERTQVTVTPNAIFEVLPNGSTQLLPPPNIKILGDALETHSAEQLVAAAEYSLYRGIFEPVVVLPKDFVTEHPVKQYKLEISAMGRQSVVRKLRSKAGHVLLSEQILVQADAVRRRKATRKATLLLLATIGVSLRGAEVFEYNYFDREPVSGIDITLAEKKVSEKLIPIVAKIEHAINPGTYFDFGPPEEPSARDEIRKRIYNLPQGNTKKSTINDRQRSPTNNPLWQISPSPGTDASGYWDVNRFESLNLSVFGGSYEWYDQLPSVFTSHNRTTSISNMQGYEPVHYIEYSGKGSIGVEGNISFYGGAYSDSVDDQTWMVVHVPVLHGNKILSLTATRINTESAEEQNEVLTTRLWSDDSGFLLFVKVPESLDVEDEYMHLQYNIAPAADSVLTIYSDVPEVGDTVYAAGAGQEEARSVFGGNSVFGVIQSLDYEVDPIANYDVNGDKVYNLYDLAVETLSAGKASCFQANTLLAALSHGELDPMKGFLLSPENIAFDIENNDGAIYIAEHDSHLYTLDQSGNIVDATPTNASQATSDYFSHKKLSKDRKGLNIIQSAQTSIDLRQGRKEQKDREDGLHILALTAGLGLVGAAVSMARKRRMKAVLNPADPKNAAALRLAVLGTYKLSDNPSAQISRAEISNKQFSPSRATARSISPKKLRKDLTKHRKQATDRYPYNVSEMKRAVRLVRAVRSQRGR